MASFVACSLPRKPGEADTWLALYQALSRHGWERVILETTGLNARVRLLRQAFGPGRVVAVKLTSSKDELLRRIALKPPDEETGPWRYEDSLPDRETFVTQLSDRFANLPAEIVSDTTYLTPDEGFAQVVEALKARGVP